MLPDEHTEAGLGEALWV